MVISRKQFFFKTNLLGVNFSQKWLAEMEFVHTSSTVEDCQALQAQGDLYSCL